MKKKPKTKQPPPPEFPCVIETFRHPGAWERDSLTRACPVVWNGIVSIRRYRITFEEVEEPKEALVERLRKLWRECDNHHHWQPLQKAADSLGFQLDSDEFGKDRKRP